MWFAWLPSAAWQYSIRNLVGVTGPQCAQVNVFYLDPDSMLWLGTGNTVERYDGSRYLCYAFAEPIKDKGENAVSSVLRTGRNTYWVGSKKGLWILNHEERRPVRVFADKVDVPVHVLGKDENDRLYVGTDNGLYIGTEESVKLSESTRGCEVIGLGTCTSRKVWMLLPEAVCFYNPATDAVSRHPAPSDTGFGAFTCCVQVGDVLYVGTEKAGVVSFDTRTGKYAPFIDKWNGAVSCLSYNGGNLLGVGTLSEGIILVSLDSGAQVYTARYNPDSKDGLTADVVSAILVCGQDILVGYGFYLGWDCLTHRSPVFSLYTCGGFTSREVPVRSFLHTDDYTFIGTREGLYVTSEKEARTRFFSKGSKGAEVLRSNLIFSFYKYNDRYLVGTCKEGAYVLDPRSMTLSPFDLSRQTDHNDFFSYMTDEDGTLWMATLGGLLRLDKGETTEALKAYTPSNSNLPGHIVYSAMLDSKKRFWVGTNKGTVFFDREAGRFEPVQFPAGFPTTDLVTEYMLEGRNGDMFLMSLDGRLFWMDGSLKSFRRLFADDGLSVEGIVQDDEGAYWVGTDKGVVRMDEDLKSFACYIPGQDIPELITTSGPPMVKDVEGKIWMANVKGLVIINPAEREEASKLQITEIMNNGELLADISVQGISDAGTYRLKSDENNLVFRFSVKGPENVNTIPLQYKLEGYDKGWVYALGKSEVTYFNLPAGTYTFKVRRLLSDGTTASVSVCISRNHFAWIAGVIVLAVLAGAGVVFLKRRRRVRDTFVPDDGEEVAVEEAAEETAHKVLKLSEEEAQVVAVHIKEYMEKEKAYLNVELKQSDMSAATGHSIQVLSYVFNQHLKTGYYDYVNAYRVEEFKRLVGEGGYEKYTLVTLAEMCGFKSRTSFFRTFKKMTGQTPNEYIQQHSK